MVQQYHFEHHLLESKRNQARFRIVLIGIFVAAVGLATPAYFLFADNQSTTTATPTPDSASVKPIAGQQNTSRQVAVVTATQAGGEAPSTPSNFQALVMDDNAVVALSWAGSADATPVKAYKLERSIDRVNWTILSDSTSELQYRDEKVAFAVHYYYRLTAFSPTGKPSSFAFADAKTGEFSANSSDTVGGTILSNDKLVSVEIPTGALADRTVACSIGTSSSKPTLGNRKLVAGPYSLVCKRQSADQIASFLKPVVWRVDLKTKLDGYSNPVVGQVTSRGAESIKATYDNKSKVVAFNQTSTSVIAVFASENTGISPSLVAMILFVVLLIVGICILVLRKKQESDYNEYLRKKYYNL